MKIISVKVISTGFELQVKSGDEVITTKTFWDNDGVDKVLIHGVTYEVVGLSKLVRLS